MVGDLPDDPQPPATVVRPGRKIRRKARIEAGAAVGHLKHDTPVVPRLHLDRRTPMLPRIGEQLIERQRQIARTVTEPVRDRQIVHRPTGRWNIIGVATQDGGEMAISALWRTKVDRKRM